MSNSFNVSCKYNTGVDCTSTVCKDGCGWNPEIAAKRKHIERSFPSFVIRELCDDCRDDIGTYFNIVQIKQERKQIECDLCGKKKTGTTYSIIHTRRI